MAIGFKLPGVKRVGITQKAFMAPGALLLILVLMGGLMLSGVGSLLTTMRYVSGYLAPASETSSDVMAAAFRERLAASAFLESHSEEAADRWRARRAEVNEMTERLRFENPERARMMEQFRDSHGGYASAFENEVIPNILRARSLQREDMGRLGTATLRAIDDVTEAVAADQIVEAVQLGTRAAREVLVTRLYVISFIDSGDERMMQAALQQHELVPPIIEELRNQFLAPNELELLDQAEASWAQYREVMNGLLEARRVATTAIGERVAPLGEEMTNNARSVQQHAMSELVQISDDIAAGSAANQRNLVVMLLLGVVMGVGLTWFLTRGYVRPLVKLNDFVDDMISDMDAGNGDLTRRADVKTRDEVGELGGNVNRFIETLQRVLSTINQETTQLASAAEELSAVT
ncbi:MAG: methyl-accepting chemotaxis protein, partial [Ectothiorhodospiraceae bacterium]|nr:methyl-accepting chemotaxis protein [Ectothiorhodospiraceae bacterium]